MSSTAKRVRQAEKTVEQARETLENAEAGLYAAERLAENDDEGRGRPILKASMLSAALSAIGFFFAKKRNRT
ncbi:MAG: hypothetical protein WD990_01565 [Acidimicrobiia bacterium]